LPDGKLHSNNGDILFKRPVLQKIMFTLGFWISPPYRHCFFVRRKWPDSLDALELIQFDNFFMALSALVFVVGSVVVLKYDKTGNLPFSLSFSRPLGDGVDALEGLRNIFHNILEWKPLIPTSVISTFLSCRRSLGGIVEFPLADYRNIVYSKL
jgi:hypothetical protein